MVNNWLEELTRLVPNESLVDRDAESEERGLSVADAPAHPEPDTGEPTPMGKR